MKRKPMKNAEIEKLRKLLVKDVGLDDAIELAKRASTSGKDIDKPERIRMPYVNSPNLLERRWK